MIAIGKYVGDKLCTIVMRKIGNITYRYITIISHTLAALPRRISQLMVTFQNKPTHIPGVSPISPALQGRPIFGSSDSADVRPIKSSRTRHIAVILVDNFH